MSVLGRYFSISMKPYQGAIVMSSIAMFDDFDDGWNPSEFLRVLADLIAEQSDDTFLSKLEELCCKKLTVNPEELKRLSKADKPSTGRDSGRDRDRADSDQKDRRQSPPSFPMERRSYTPKQIANLEGVNPATVRGWIHDRKLRSVPDPHRMAGPLRTPRHSGRGLSEVQTRRTLGRATSFSTTNRTCGM